MKPSLEQVENLLALKRHECPEDGYWQDFLREFHHRQRQQAVAGAGLAAWWKQVSAWVAERNPAKWAYGAGLAYAAVAVWFLMPRPVDREPGPPSVAPVNYQVVPAAEPAVEQLEALDLSPGTQGSVGEQVF